MLHFRILSLPSLILLVVAWSASSYRLLYEKVDISTTTLHLGTLDASGNTTSLPYKPCPNPTANQELSHFDSPTSTLYRAQWWSSRFGVYLQDLVQVQAQTGKCTLLFTYGPPPDTGLLSFFSFDKQKDVLWSCALYYAAMECFSVGITSKSVLSYANKSFVGLSPGGLPGSDYFFDFDSQALYFILYNLTSSSDTRFAKMDLATTKTTIFNLKAPPKVQWKYLAQKKVAIGVYMDDLSSSLSFYQYDLNEGLSHWSCVVDSSIYEFSGFDYDESVGRYLIGARGRGSFLVWADTATTSCTLHPIAIDPSTGGPNYIAIWP